MQLIDVIELCSFDLEGRTEIRRRPYFQVNDDDNLDRFDTTTLWYDAVRLSHNKRVLVTAPPLGDLRQVLFDGLKVDGKPAKIASEFHVLRKKPRCSQVVIRCPQSAKLTFELENTVYDIPVRTSISEQFNGCNALVTLGKNESLENVRDWVRFHVNAHGADAVLYFDNGSDIYALEELAACLASVDGVKTSAVVSAPFEYGGRLVREHGRKVIYQFLQISLLNLARSDFLRGARAVLNADVDEMVMRGKTSVFDLAAKSILGGFLIPGLWIYPAQGSRPPLPHSENSYQSPNSRCQNKWCARPASWISRAGWDVHQLGFSRRKLLGMAPNDTWLAHCAATTTGWKPIDKSRRYKSGDGAVLNEDLARQWAAYLGPVGASD